MPKFVSADMERRRLRSTLSSVASCGKPFTLVRNKVRSIGCGFSYGHQNAILPTSTSHTSHITNTPRGRASRTPLVQIRSHPHQGTNHSTFPLSFNHPTKTALLCSRFSVRNHIPFSERKPSHSSLDFHGDPLPTHFSMSPPPLLLSNPLSRTALQPFRHLSRLPASSLHRYAASVSAPSRLRARCGARALLRVAPCRTAKPCGS